MRSLSSLKLPTHIEVVIIEFKICTPFQKMSNFTLQNFCVTILIAIVIVRNLIGKLEIYFGSYQKIKINNDFWSTKEDISWKCDTKSGKEIFCSPSRKQKGTNWKRKRHPGCLCVRVDNNKHPTDRSRKYETLSQSGIQQ